MSRTDIDIYAKVFAILSSVLNRGNAADVEEAKKNPLKMIAAYHNDAIACHLLTEELKDKIGEQFAGLSEEAINAGTFELSQEEQAAFELAYQKSVNEMK